METNFADTPRVKGRPFSKRIGDNLLERDNTGHVCSHIAFYSLSQQLARQHLSRKMERELDRDSIIGNL